jgi:2-dehydro-3-deoxy-D-arabinonate dehydratase
VPEPELTLVINSRGRIVGYTIGNDMSSRDIEGANPLYLPQAKVYSQSCALGPSVLVTDTPLDPQTKIELAIERDGKVAFQGETTISQMKRTPEDLVSWLFRENSFPTGCFLLTGTGVVPPDDFTLRSGDVIGIEIEPIGRLVNQVR